MSQQYIQSTEMLPLCLHSLHICKLSVKRMHKKTPTPVFCLCFLDSAVNCSCVSCVWSISKECTVPCSIPSWLESSVPMRGPQGPLVSWALMYHSPRSSMQTRKCTQTSQNRCVQSDIYKHWQTSVIEMTGVKWHLWQVTPFLCIIMMSTCLVFCKNYKIIYLFTVERKSNGTVVNFLVFRINWL